MSIAYQLSFVRGTLPEYVTLVAVSKTHPAGAIREAYDAGHRIFGESRPQELREKYDVLPKDIEWHMIGHLQTNKVKYIAPFVSLIHSACAGGRQSWPRSPPFLYAQSPARSRQMRPHDRDTARNPRRRRGEQIGLGAG